MKLHLPLFLRKAILALMLAYGVPAVQAADLTLGAEDSLSVDYSVSGSLQDLNNGTLQLSGGTTLQLSSCGEGDGKTYTLLTGVSSLLGADGSAITLDDTNNAASRYFDTTQPGSGFWADGTLQLNNGALQIVLHNETVKEAISITTRQVNPSAYQYYAGVSFENIEYDFGSSYAKGGAIYGAGDITLSNNGSVTFSGNTASVSSYSSSTSSYGGAIYGSTITLSDNGSVSFSGNTASTSSSYSSYSYSDSAYGGAIYGDTITLSDNGSVTFSGNTASASSSCSSTSSYGGAIYGSTITLSDNGSVSFSGNTASASSSYYYGSSTSYGGAIYGDDSTITLSDNESVSFIGNTASASPFAAGAYGGAIYGDTIRLSDNGSVTFSGNTASASNSSYGGAIYDRTITLSDNESVSFSGNTAESASSRAKGGAIYGDVTMTGNGDVSFSENTASSSSTYDFSYGGAIYGSTITLSDNGSVSFSRNTASASTSSYGGAIYGDSYSTITLSNNGSVSFSGNTASAKGGAIYEDSYSTIKLSNNGSVTFSGNTAFAAFDACGGAIYGSTITLSDNGSVTFSGNTAPSYSSTSAAYGGAIYGSTITLSDNGSVVFEGNTASGSSRAYGGAIYGDVTMTGNGDVSFSGNTASSTTTTTTTSSSSYYYAYAYGGAIYGSTITLSDNGSVSFSGNTASSSDDDARGGAIYGYDSTITLSDNESVSFIGNTAESAPSTTSSYGGAIYGDTITLSDNGSVTFSGNTASASTYAYGGAIYGDTITLSDNGSVTFSGNTASASTYAYGGAIYDHTITLSDNESVSFIGNTAESASSSASGGAIYGDVTMTGNGDVSFSGNTASSSSSSSSDSDSSAYGGAIYGNYYGSTITLSDNGSVTFSGNTASASSSYYYASDSAYGGAIYGDDSTITLSDNESVSFIGNTAESASSSAYGGAIYGHSYSIITLSNNGSVVFEGNTAESASSSYYYASDSAYGGAIYGDFYSTITLSNNGSVSLSGNTATGNYAYGGAIYACGDLSIRNNASVAFYQNAEVVNGNTYRLRSIYAGGSGAEISLSAAAGKSITFRDSIYIGESSSFKLNEAYEGKAQLGDIIFTGATTESDLYTVKGNVAGTMEEIRLSRTTEVNTMTNLYGGRLRVEDGAVYRGRGITAMADSKSTVRGKNATLSQKGYTLTFNSGTTLELAGANTITGNVQMENGSILSFDCSESEGMTVIDGTMNLGGTLSLTLNGEVDAENVVLLYASDGIGGWNEGYINTAGNSYALLDNELLVLNYNKNAGLPAFKGDTVITSRQSTAGTYKYYNSVTFQNIAGGAMYGGAMDGSLEMSHNGGIRFIGNSARFGGALSGSTVALNHNGSVLFENNNATGASYAYGGAIYGKNNSSISLIGNDSVAFKNNTSTTYGGAIFVTQGTAIKLHENGSVIFTGNSTDDCGGAIFSQVTVSLKDNESVTFSGNYAGYGGAMDVRGNIELCGNGNVVFSGNCALDASYSYGGAIYTSGNLHLCNNDSVLFERNLEKTGGEYNLRSIHVGGNTVSFSAAEGKTIEFRDSMFVDSGTTFNLNETYYGEAQTGDILFTGEYTEKHLNEMMAAEGVGRKASSAEILDSRTTEVRALTNLHGGRLRVEDGAVYKGYGITTMADSSATVRVKSGTLNHQRYAVTFNRGTALEVAGQSSISANVLNLQQGSTLTFKLSNENSSKAVLTLSGSLNIQGAITLNLGLEGTELNAGMYKLLDLGSASVPSNWKKQNLTVESEYFEYEELTWVGSVLYLNNGRYISTDAPVIPDTPVTPEEPEIPDTPVIPDEPGSDEPGSELPGGDEPGSDEPGGELPGGDEPGSDEPGGELPGGDEPGNDEPGGELPGGDEPGSDEPGSDEPGGELPGGDEPGNDGPGGELPGGDEPGSNEPGGELPGGDEPGNDESGGELPGGDEPGIPDTPVTPDKPEGNKTVRPSGNTISTSEVTSNSKLVLEGKGTLTLNGKVSPASISVNISKNLTLKGAKTGGALAGDGDLTKKGNGTLTLNDGNGSWTGDTHLLAGTIKVKGTTSLGKGDVYVKGGTLNLGSKAIGNDIVQEKSATIKSGKKFTGTYTLESGELLKGSTLNISKTATLEGGSVNGTLTGTGTTTVTGNVKLGDKGKITTKALTLGEDATLTTSAKGLSSKTTTLSIGEDATLSLGGKMTVDSLKMNGGTLKTTASKPVAMTVKNNMELTDAVLSTNGKVTTNKLTLNNSTMGIKGAKAQNLTVKQALTIGSGSALTLNGKLSAGSLTIKSGGSLTMIGSKPVTLKVKGTLTLNEGSSIIMNYSFVQGKTYKVLTFGSYSGSKDYYSIFGVEADDCTITNTGKALTLTVTGKWKPQSQQKAVSADAATPIVAAKPQTNPVADALVQANWGQLEASRAFVNAMANRSMAVQLGNGERAVWASAIGSSSRHSSAGGHAGADTNVSGGVFGLETQVGRASLFGMALGNSWTRVSAHGFGTIEQDTTHLGLYGQSNWSSGISADWSAAYGRSESEAMGSDWNQKHLQLDGRVSYNHELNARTVLSPFAGVQYYASDAAGIGTTDTGSLQNLRAEIGVAASHRTGKLGVYGEIALHQDLARNNPSVSMEGVRYTGMNPGRTGLNFTIGASYELNDKWSVNASYTGEFVENANAHSANVGASYKF